MTFIIDAHLKYKSKLHSLPSKMLELHFTLLFMLKYTFPSHLIQNILENFHYPPLRETWIAFSSPLMLKSTLYSLNIFFISNSLAKN